ncbi:MAG TPA: dTMP kinase [Bacteroidales bacterium]|nr:dTMP kinase [Bacteroidales bacterium]
MKFLVIEGVDGSGKSTQIKLMMKHLEEKGIRYKYIHFPRTESPVFGELIARFLRGDFGTLNSVDPYLVALLYAGDRRDAAPLIRDWLNTGYFVILDRYVYSNIAFQCAKLTKTEEQERLGNWIVDLEYNYNQIPRPDLNLLLDVPFSFTASKLSGNRAGSERDYLQGLRDIHEEDLDFQQRVRNIYLMQAAACTDLKIINCTDEKGTMLAPESIFGKILDTIE